MPDQFDLSLGYVPNSWSYQPTAASLGSLSIGRKWDPNMLAPELGQSIPESFGNYRGLGATTADSSNTWGNIGWNTPTLSLALNGLSGLAGLIGANKQLGLARDQFNFNKKFAETNLANQTNAYNTKLEYRLRNRAQMQNDTSDNWKKDFERLKAIK